MKKLFVTLATMICLGSCSKEVNPNVNPVNPNANPVNPNANQATKKVYDYLWDLSYGTTPGVIVGQNAGHGADYFFNPDNPDFIGAYKYNIDSLVMKSGKYPGMLGVDYEYTLTNSLETLKRVNTSLAAYWNAGGLITINYTPRNILTDDILYENDHPQDSRSDSRTAGQMNKILPGGSLRSAWLARLDVITAALQDLQTKGVTVLWRPMQEFNGWWFWYGLNTPGRPAGQSNADYIAVWKDMYNYFTNTKKLNNLLWVYAPVGDPFGSPYPGSAFVDIVAPTSYQDFPIQAYEEDAAYYEVAFGGKKILAMSEFGPSDTIRIDNRQYLTTMSKNPKFAYFVAWHDEWSIQDNNNASEMMNDSRSITRDKIPNLK